MKLVKIKVRKSGWDWDLAENALSPHCALR